jgi:hypothetical protein
VFAEREEEVGQRIEFVEFSPGTPRQTGRACLATYILIDVVILMTGATQAYIGR